MIRILSTKILSQQQKALLFPLNILLEEYEGISVSYTAFTLNKAFDYLLITSQNAVRSLLAHLKGVADPASLLEKKAFCVGEITALLLERSGIGVVHFENNAEALGHYLVEKHPQNTFLFLCGDKRREELPGILKKHSIDFQEVVVYQTSLNPVAIDREYDGYLFFSPSAVKSFTMKNPLRTGTAFCIGPTTAEAARNARFPVKVAASPSVEGVLQLLIDTYNTKKN